MRRRSVVAVSRLLFMPLVAAACSTTSTVENRSGGVVEAHILGGSPGSVYLANKDNGRFAMRRDDIADADFPGNVAMFGGVALVGLGGWWLRASDINCGTFGDAGACLLNVAPLIVGFMAAVWGGYVFGRANRRFEDRSKPEPDAVVRPRPPEQPHPPGWRKPDPFADPR